MENMEARVTPPAGETANEGIKVIQMLRLLSGEDQRIAYAVLEGMKLQKTISQQNGGIPLKVSR